MRTEIKNLQKVTVNLEKWDRFGFLEFQVFCQTNMRHIHS